MAQQPPYYSQAAPPQQQPQKKGTNTCLIVGLVIAAISVPVLGVMAALGIYGVRRYLAAAKTAEAKSTVSAISRAAQAAYEREDASGKHHLCASAKPVPAVVPAGAKYMPSSAPGADFQSGSPTAGWPCLKFSMSMPFYYQYHYQQGSGWVAPANAPGPNGFEAAAVGDLDGNGTKSVFSRTGIVSGSTVTIATNMHVENEFE